MTQPSWADYGTYGNSAFPELWDGCIGAWCPSLGPTGLKLFDVSGYNHHGTISGVNADTAWSTALGGQYNFKMDGSNDEATIGDWPTLRPLSVSLSCWVTFGATGQVGKVIAGKWNYSTNQRGWMLQAVATNQVMWSAQSAGTPYDANKSATSATIFSADRWYHLCGVLTAGQTPKLYVNGVLDATAASTSAGYATTATFEIGGYSAGDVSGFFNGRVDDIRVYNRGLSDSEARLLANRRGIAYTRKSTASIFLFATDADDESSSSSLSSPSSASSLSSASSASSPSSASSLSTSSSSSSSISTSSSSGVGTGEYQQVSATSSVKTAAAFGIPADCSFVEITADTQEVRYTMDNSTSPSQSSGMRFRVGGRSKIFSIDDFRRIKFVRGAGSDGVLNVHFLTDL